MQHPSLRQEERDVTVAERSFELAIAAPETAPVEGDSQSLLIPLRVLAPIRLSRGGAVGRHGFKG